MTSRVLIVVLLCLSRLGRSTGDSRLGRRSHMHAAAPCARTPPCTTLLEWYPEPPSIPFVLALALSVGPTTPATPMPRHRLWLCTPAGGRVRAALRSEASCGSNVRSSSRCARPAPPLHLARAVVPHRGPRHRWWLCPRMCP
ncbi:hypothetical protein B0H17DRAFT_1069557 [Mycena rosella]|uniref:Secreted protein n=1 Tax=Mycena rosella TaxID=1033263 RepID=A0AAD7GH08_MYCRO|nr:hypothetical protein B0H17DRAFT_1069557 [Mycena rosella]